MTEEIRIDRLIRAPQERVFAAFTEPDGQEAFYSRPEPGWVVRSTCDLRVGGAWTIDFGPSADELYRHHHVFAAIDPPRRVALATTETRLDGSTVEFETTFEFEAAVGGTRLIAIQRGLPTEELREEHSRGVPHALDAFARTIEE